MGLRGDEWGDKDKGVGWKINGSKGGKRGREGDEGMGRKKGGMIRMGRDVEGVGLMIRGGGVGRGRCMKGLGRGGGGKVKNDNIGLKEGGW